MNDDAEPHGEELRRLIEELIKPQIQRIAEQLQDLGSEELRQLDLSHIDIELPPDLAEIGGEAMMVASSDIAATQETMQRIQEKLQEGFSMDYILQELTDVRIDHMGEKQIGNLRVSYLHLDTRHDPDCPATPSADELREMFER